MANIEQSGNLITIDGKNSPEVLENIFQNSPIGPISTAIGDTFYGINHRLMPNAIPINRDHYGLTFFTRPELNLTSENIRNVRLFAPLLTTESRSIPAFIRGWLDHALAKNQANACPFVDNQQAFIPILTDTLISISGWPDIEAPMYSSPEGVYKETYSIIDGITENYSAYNIQANFRNVIGDPITAIFLNWIHYGSRVFRGDIIPYPENIIENRVDYNTRIYRLVLDVNRNKVQKIAACGAAIPQAISIGASFNYESDRPINASNDQITVPFKCVGAMYQDDILIHEFNLTVQYFNRAMADDMRNSSYVKIPSDYLLLFNHKGYPRINPNTYELEWWVDKETYARLTAPLK